MAREPSFEEGTVVPERQPGRPLFRGTTWNNVAPSLRDRRSGGSFPGKRAVGLAIQSLGVDCQQVIVEQGTSSVY